MSRLWSGWSEVPWRHAGKSAPHPFCRCANDTGASAFCTELGFRQSQEASGSVTSPTATLTAPRDGGPPQTHTFKS